jgi:hypothetical protein
MTLHLRPHDPMTCGGRAIMMTMSMAEICCGGAAIIAFALARGAGSVTRSGLVVSRVVCGRTAGLPVGLPTWVI